MAKTKKALLKRIKITGTGKILRRPQNQNHFNAKDSGDESRRKRGFLGTSKKVRKLAQALTQNV